MSPLNIQILNKKDKSSLGCLMLSKILCGQVLKSFIMKYLLRTLETIKCVDIFAKLELNFDKQISLISHNQRIEKEINSASLSPLFSFSPLEPLSSCASEQTLGKNIAASGLVTISFYRATNV